MKEAPGERRKHTADDTSSGLPSRFVGRYCVEWRHELNELFSFLFRYAFRNFKDSLGGKRTLNESPYFTPNWVFFPKERLHKKMKHKRGNISLGYRDALLTYCVEFQHGLDELFSFPFGYALRNYLDGL